MLRNAVLASWVLLSMPAFAMIDPAPSAQDPRVRTAPYNPEQVVHLVSVGGAPITVVFDDGESVGVTTGKDVFKKPEDAAERGGWSTVKAGKTLIITPYKSPDPTLMMVLTVGADPTTNRTYQFQLESRSGNATDINSGAMVTVLFRYKVRPDPLAMEQASLAAAHQQDVRAQAVVERQIQVDAAISATNTAYGMRGVACDRIAPLYGYDDGHRTTFFYPQGRTLPSIYMWNDATSQPSLLTPVMQNTPSGVSVVIPSVNRHYRLSANKLVCDISNSVVDPVGTPLGNGSGTVSPNVRREAVQ